MVETSLLLVHELFAVPDNDALVILGHTLAGKVVGDGRNSFGGNNGADACTIIEDVWVFSKHFDEEILRASLIDQRLGVVFKFPDKVLDLVCVGIPDF